MYIALAVISFGVLIGLVLGAPYVPTQTKGFSRVLRKIGAQKGDILYDLGFGSGTILVRAAQAGLRVRGFEINPLLWLITKARLRGTDHKLHLRPWQGADVSDADIVYVFTTTPHGRSNFFERLPAQATIVSFGVEITALQQRRSARTVGAYIIYEPVVREEKKR